MSPTGEGTAILHGHPSHAKPFVCRTKIVAEFISFLSTVVEDPEYQSSLKRIEPTTFRSAVKVFYRQS